MQAGHRRLEAQIARPTDIHSMKIWLDDIALSYNKEKNLQ
jgi:hypothetical protein